jgi:putative membrane protein insertion efficiency factor
MWFQEWILMSFLDQYRKISIKNYLEMNSNFIWKSFASGFYLSLDILVRKISLIMIASYRTIGTSFLGGCCRFEPSCSEYAMKCFHELSLGKAFGYSFIRICKCRPFGPVGYDPVPVFDSMENIKHATK